MLEKIIQWDQEIFVFLNSLHTDFLDAPMMFLTKTLASLPLYLVLLYFTVKFYKKDAIFIILTVALLILVSDQFASGFCKPFFGRLRPCYEPAITSIHLPSNSCGGKFGFISSHSINVFATAFYFSRILKPKLKFPISILLILWAAIIAYTRIYLGKHYLLDILVPIPFAFGFAWCCFKLQESLRKKFGLERKID